MKRFVKLLVFAAVMTACLTVSALDATVVSVKGKVEIQDGSVWAPIDEGDVIEKGTVISTGFKSEVVLAVKGSKFTLGPLTRLTIEDLVSSSTKDSTQLFIDSGSIKADVGSADGKKVGFKVRSAVATASVRGTAFSLSSSGKLAVSKGLVALGPAESTSPEVNTDSKDEVAEAAPEEAAAASAEGGSETAGAEAAVAEAAPAPVTTALTSAEDVGGFAGVPVAAGQVSKADPTSGRVSSPQSEKAKASSGAASSSTESIASQEAVASAPASSAPSVSPAAAASTPSSKKGSMRINVRFASN